MIEYISRTAKIHQTDLIEKDLLLHALLTELLKDLNFRDNYCFKGGTCLTKCYFGYFRFSEDLDFSFIPQSLFKNKSEKEIRRIISKLLIDLLRLIKNCSTQLGMSFETEKKHNKFIEFGGSNKFITFKLWYDSVILKQEQFIKIQINFVEQFIHPVKSKIASAITDLSLDKEFEFLFPEYRHISNTMPVNAYCLDEILSEKLRAILTRKGIKTRDAIDIYLILQKQKKNLNSYEADALTKTRFMLKYKKYKQNLKDKKFDGLFGRSEEQRLLIKPLDSETFLTFQKELVEFLEKLKRLI